MSGENENTVSLPVYGLQKMSMVDWPDGIAAVVFTGGCDLRCPYCYNSSLVEYEKYGTERLGADYIMNFLEERRDFLDAVVLSGGEPLMHTGVKEFARAVKDMGYIFKLDTNGTYPDKLARLLETGLVDYVAMDIKNCPEKYARTAGVPAIDISKILKSVDILKNSGIDYEFRTTVVRQYHTPADMLKIAEWLKGAQAYYIQKFTEPGPLVGDVRLTPYSDDEMYRLREIVAPYFEKTGVRGTDV
ncbi:MAG: anaerobic ribonucleoside-triphosphate reductase activating protein [Anaerovoracaceae bacterium]|jgi:pyruvate formate lyase activating enzyme